MDNFDMLVEGKIKKVMEDSNYIKSAPCYVKSLENNDLVRVVLITSNAEYVVPNYSGSNVGVGEFVQLYYRGDFIYESSAYIGASNTKAMDYSQMRLNYINGSRLNGEIMSVDRTLSKIYAKCMRTTSCFVSINANVYGSTESGNCTFKISVDGDTQDFQPINMVTLENYTICAYTLPITIDAGEHEITVYVSGTGNVISQNCYMYGQGIEEYKSYDITTDEDYIYETFDGKTNVIYYIGSSKNPEIPTMIHNAPVKKLYATSFNYSEVQTVYIPDGVEEIE